MTTEMVILTPLIVIIALFAVVLGRIELAAGELNDAARAAAQAAVIWPTSNQAIRAASETAAFTLHSDSITCGSYELGADTGDFRPGGSITVSISCTVSLSQVALPGMPGSHEITARVSAPIESYRAVQG